MEFLMGLRLVKRSGRNVGRTRFNELKNVTNNSSKD